ncbi:MAG: DUF1566 domain-containing protein, partial [Alphaproteobacteria bacterium]|nr:DUF1566 domain-containing protein [Alphaproteobacteria bacterium]
VVGAYLDDAGASNAGRAYLFNATTGALLFTLANPSPALNENFGRGVAIKGNRAVVGSQNQANAYVFNTGTGTLVSTLVSPVAGNTLFGRAVAISGNTVFVGASGDGTDGSNNGMVYVYNIETGVLLSTIHNPKPDINNDTFGDSLAVAGNRLVVSAKRDDGSDVDGDTGVIHVFKPIADCTGPDGVEGALVYNTSEDLLQYCNGMGWQVVGKKPPADACAAASPAIGQLCLDGTRYAGTTPDGGGKMFATAADQSAGIRWSSEQVLTGINNANSGSSNQAWVEANKSLAIYPAFGLCADLTTGGHTDWYLPSANELLVLFTNRVAIGGFSPGDKYWSSTEATSANARTYTFYGPFFDNDAKTNVNWAVRCVRKN